jgi:hypothetical protein
MNISLLKHGFQVWASWRLKKMFKVSTYSFHAGIAGDRLLESYFLPPHLTGAVYCDFLWNVLPELLLQDVHLQTRTHLCYAWWWSNTFSSCILAILVHVSRTVCRVRTTKSMACSFSWFKSLRLLFLGHLKPTLYATEVSAVHDLQQWIQNSLEMIHVSTGIFQQVRWSLFRHAMTCIQAKVWHVRYLFSNLEVAMIEKPYFRRPMSVKYIFFFLVLWCEFTSCRFDHSFLYIMYVSILFEWLHC